LIYSNGKKLSLCFFDDKAKLVVILSQCPAKMLKVKNKNKKAPPAGQNILHLAGGAFGCCK
jgi:hypothetical protein